MSAPVIQVTELTKTFGPVLAVDSISFAVAEGQTVGLLGGNGAGRSEEQIGRAHV